MIVGVAVVLMNVQVSWYCSPTMLIPDGVMKTISSSD